MKLSIHLALRYLRSSDRTSFSSFAGKLSIIGLGVGIAALVLTAAIYKGFEDTISNKIAGFDGHIRIQDFLADLSQIIQQDLIVFYLILL